MKAYAGERRRGQDVRSGKGKQISWMALELEDVQRYKSVRKPDQIVPVGGKYLRE